MNTASEQFVQDYLLVMENDEDAYRDLISESHNHDSVVAFAQHLRDEWDDYVDQVYNLAVREWGEAPAALLIRQMMGGWGATEFESIAKQFKILQEA